MTKTTDKMNEAAQQIIALMKEHGTNWAKPWTGIGGVHNAKSKKPYRGSNIFWLSLSAHAQGFEGNEWATFKQWKELGATVKKGSKATPIFFFSVLERDNKETGEKDKFGFWKSYSVFNAAQVEGYETAKPATQFDAIKAAESYVANSGAEIRNGGDRAYYHPIGDYIGMPPREAFESGTGYYSTLLHELTHWTGHKSRCDRDLTGGFGSENYAKEELIAECGAALLCMQLGVEKQATPEHAKYLNNWIQAIGNDYKVIFTAISKAQKAIDHLDSLQESIAIAAE